MSMDDFIPPGFVPLANWDSRHRRHNDGHSVEWKTLSDAVKNSEIPGFKLSNGRWYVHEGVSNEHLAKLSPKAEPAVKQVPCAASESSVIALCEISNTLSLTYDVLVRLTAAIETAAVRRKETDVIDMNTFGN